MKIPSTDGSKEEAAKLKLWNIVGSQNRGLNLTVFVDNSVIEVHANEASLLTLSRLISNSC